LGQEGNYIFVSDDWHINKLRKIEKVLKKKEKISNRLNLEYVSAGKCDYYNFLERFLSDMKTRLELLFI